MTHIVYLREPGQVKMARPIFELAPNKSLGLFLPGCFTTFLFFLRFSKISEMYIRCSIRTDPKYLSATFQFLLGYIHNMYIAQQKYVTHVNNNYNIGKKTLVLLRRFVEVIRNGISVRRQPSYTYVRDINPNVLDK